MYVAIIQFSNVIKSRKRLLTNTRQRLNFSALNKISILILKERSCISVIDYREPSNQSKEEFNQLHSDASTSLHFYYFCLLL